MLLGVDSTRALDRDLVLSDFVVGDRIRSESGVLFVDTRKDKDGIYRTRVLNLPMRSHYETREERLLRLYVKGVSKRKLRKSHAEYVVHIKKKRKLEDAKCT